MKVNPGWLQQIESSKPVKGNVPAAVSTAILLRLISRNRRNMVGEFIQSVRRDTKKKEEERKQNTHGDTRKEEKRLKRLYGPGGWFSFPGDGARGVGCSAEMTR